MPQSPTLWQSGLTTRQVDVQHQQFGDNLIPHRPPPGDLYFFLVQFKNPLVIVLIIASTITFFLKEFTDSAVIGLAIIVNTILGFIQERKAYKIRNHIRTWKKDYTIQTMMMILMGIARFPKIFL